MSTPPGILTAFLHDHLGVNDTLVVDEFKFSKKLIISNEMFQAVTRGQTCKVWGSVRFPRDSVD